MKQTFYIWRGGVAADAKGRLAKHFLALPDDRAWKVTVEEKKATRSLEQNSLLWALYEDIIRLGGETMAGWEGSDLHEFFLGEHYGWERLDGMKRPKLKPLRRSSKMGKVEFSEHLQFIARYMSQQGIILELPDE